MATSNPSSSSSAGAHPRHRNRRYSHLSSVMTPIENSAQWRQLLSKAKSAERQTNDDVPDTIHRRSPTLTPAETSTAMTAGVHPQHRNRKSYNRFSSVMTPIENSAQWRELLSKAKSAERQTNDDVPDTIHRRSPALTPAETSTAMTAGIKPQHRNRRSYNRHLSSVMTPIENSAQWREILANAKSAERQTDDDVPDTIELTPAKSSTQWRAAMAAAKPVEKLKDNHRRPRRRADDLVSVLTPIENLQQWRSVVPESAVESVEDGASAAVSDQPVDVSFTGWLHA